MISEEVGIEGETEDLYYRRINVGHLMHAFELMQKYGRGTLLKYCREKKFSADDIERVEFKFERSFGKNHVPDIKKTDQAGYVPF